MRHLNIGPHEVSTVKIIQIWTIYHPFSSTEETSKCSFFKICVRIYSCSCVMTHGNQILTFQRILVSENQYSYSEKEIVLVFSTLNSIWDSCNLIYSLLHDDCVVSILDNDFESMREDSFASSHFMSVRRSVKYENPHSTTWRNKPNTFDSRYIRSNIKFKCLTLLNVCRVHGTFPNALITTGCCVLTMMMGNIRWTLAGYAYQLHSL